jgi:CBS domain-containing protein
MAPMDLREALVDETVASVGYRDLVSVGIDASVGSALSLMREREVGCLCVLDAGRLAGIFTERDLIVQVLGRGISMTAPVAEHMSPDPTTVRLDDPVHVVLARMNEGGFRHIPVVDAEGLPVGTMSVKRAVHFLADHMPQAILNLPPSPDVYPATPEGA